MEGLMSDTFDLFAMECSDEKREIVIRYNGDSHRIVFKKIGDFGAPGGLWLVPGDQVAQAFGAAYYKDHLNVYIGNFIGILVQACLAAGFSPPVSNLDIGVIKQAASKGRSFGELISSMLFERLQRPE
jgi:hypothetical protein